MTELTEDEIIQQLGTVFKNHRLRKGVSIRKVYRDSKLSCSLISDFENGGRGTALKSFMKLWKALDVPISEITKAMTQKIPELELDIRPVKCCANCVNSTKGTSLMCTVTDKYTNSDLCCRKYKGDINEFLRV